MLIHWVCKGNQTRQINHRDFNWTHEFINKTTQTQTFQWGPWQNGNILQMAIEGRKERKLGICIVQWYKLNVVCTNTSYLKENPDSSTNTSNRPSQEEQYYNKICRIVIRDAVRCNDIKQNTCTDKNIYIQWLYDQTRKLTY